MSLIKQLLAIAYLIATVNANPIKPFDPSQADDMPGRAIPVYASLIPTSTVDFLTEPNNDATPSLARAPSSPVALATITHAVDLKRDALTMPDLVPTSIVNMATDTAGVRTISPLLVPTEIATIGSSVTTTGCEVSIVDRQYVTYCSDVNGALQTAAAAAVLGSLETTSGPSWCCGGEDDLHACTEDGTIPKGPDEWTCTIGSTTYVGVTTATATL